MKAHATKATIRGERAGTITIRKKIEMASNGRLYIYQ